MNSGTRLPSSGWEKWSIARCQIFLSVAILVIAPSISKFDGKLMLFLLFGQLKRHQTPSTHGAGTRRPGAHCSGVGDFPRLFSETALVLSPLFLHFADGCHEPWLASRYILSQLPATYQR